MKRKIIDDEFIGRLEALVLGMKNPMNGFFGGSHRTRSYGSTVEFADFREYVLGDDLRKIDWNLYSRFEKHFIKLFVDERQMHNQVFIDCSSSMSSIDPDKAFYTLRLAAAIGFLSVQGMDKLSYKMLRNDYCEDLCGVIVGRDNFFNAINSLEAIEFKGTVDLEKAVLSNTNPGRNDGLTIIVSDFLTENNWKKAVDYLLYHRRQVMIVQVLSPEEINPLMNGRTALMDAESENVMDTRNMKMKINRGSLDAYRRALKDYIESIKTFCSSRGVDFISLSSGEAVERFIFKNLQEVGVIK